MVEHGHHVFFWTNSMPTKLPITVIALTLDEEDHLPEYLDHVLSFAEDVFIVDSLSCDHTVQIAREKGVKVIQRPFTSFGDQWNFAVQMLPIKTPWVMKLDPDERCETSLLTFLESALATSHCNGWLLPFQLYFLDKPLPVYHKHLRIWRNGKCYYEKVLVNEHPIIEGAINEIARSNGVVRHLDTKNLHRWFEKQNYYTTLTAIEQYKHAPQAAKPRFLGGSWLERRMALKALYYHAPFAPALEFFYHLIIDRAILAGRAGITWACLRALVRYMIDIKIREFKLQGKAIAPPTRPRGEYDPIVLASELQQCVDKYRQIQN